MIKTYEPISISDHTRNARVLDTLLGMGSAVIPIYANEEHQIIDHFIVSCGVPNIVNRNNNQG
jgi:hypothetical protein